MPLLDLACILVFKSLQSSVRLMYCGRFAPNLNFGAAAENLQKWPTRRALTRRSLRAASAAPSVSYFITTRFYRGDPAGSSFFALRTSARLSHVA